MDGTSVTTLITALVPTLLAAVAIYRTIVNTNTKIRVDDATLIRSNLIPTSVWLEQQAKRDEQIRLLNERIDKQRDEYENRLSEKDAHIELISENFRKEIQARDVQIEKLKDELVSLRHRVGNVEQIDQFKKDNLL